MMAVDVRRAYFYAPSRRPIYIEIPIEDFESGDEGRVGRLNLSLYGTRDAAQNWSQEYTAYLRREGFEVGKASPCNFKHSHRELVVTVHGDDFTATGPEEDLQWFKKTMAALYEVKVSLLGPEEHMSQEVRILNRTLAWTADGVTYEPDSKHAELIIKEMQLTEGKSVSSPVIPYDPDIKDQREQSAELSKTEAARYRGIAAR